MRLRDERGRVGLSVVGYQCGDAGYWWDANWLLIRGDVDMDGDAWSFEDPCLLTTESLRLGRWLAHAADPEAEVEWLTFTEPNLWFDRRHCSASSVVLRVGFELEARPPDRPSSTADDDEVWMDLHLSGDQLRQASAAWLDELRRYPVRSVAERPG